MRKTITTSLCLAAAAFVAFCCGSLIAQDSENASSEQTSGKSKSQQKQKVDQAKKIDQSGVNWVMPFSAALEKAKKENRMIAIKLIAGGTNAIGCW